MRVKDYIRAGKAIHKDYGLVRVLGAKTGAKTMVDIECIQRGKGWNEAAERYEIYRECTLWSPEGRTIRRGFTQRDEYGKQDTVHIKDLKVC